MPRVPDTRLLYASRVAYSIPVDGGGMPPPPAAYGLSDIETFSAGVDRINAALIASAEEGLILAFRGTLPPGGKAPLRILLDWLNDLNAALVPGGDLPGRVHHGFLEALDSLWPLLRDRLVARAQATPAAKLYVTGHSKGGSMAYLAGPRCLAFLRQAGVANPVAVHTFAAARAGDQAFADGFNARLPNAVRYEYAEDIVPHVPPEHVFEQLMRRGLDVATLNAFEEGYVSAGVLSYFPRGSTDTAVPEADSGKLELSRILRIADLLAHEKYREIIDDHSIQPGSGYANAITGGS